MLKHDSVLSIRREHDLPILGAPDVRYWAISRLIDDSISPNKISPNKEISLPEPEAEKSFPNMGISVDPKLFVRLFVRGEYRFFATCSVCRLIYNTKFAEKEREMWSAWYRRTSEPMASTDGHLEWLEKYGEDLSDSAGDLEADLYCGKDDLRRKSPGYLLNSDQPASDGNYYSIDRSKNLWDLFQCVPKNVSAPGFTVVTLATGLTVDELYQKLESVNVFVEGHEAIALGLPFHGENI